MIIIILNCRASKNHYVMLCCYNCIVAICAYLESWRTPLQGYFITCLFLVAVTLYMVHTPKILCCCLYMQSYTSSCITCWYVLSDYCGHDLSIPIMTILAFSYLAISDLLFIIIILHYLHFIRYCSTNAKYYLKGLGT